MMNFGKKKMKEPLRSFYYECLLPEMVDPRHERHMKPRERGETNAIFNKKRILETRKKEAVPIKRQKVGNRLNKINNVSQKTCIEKKTDSESSAIAEASVESQQEVICAVADNFDIKLVLDDISGVRNLLRNNSNVLRHFESRS